MNQLIMQLFAYPEEFSQMQVIRRSVFQEEQGVDPALEFDGLDEIADHLLAYLDNQPVGTARIRYLNQHTAKVERLAVLSEARGKGLARN